MDNKESLYRNANGVKRTYLELQADHSRAIERRDAASKQIEVALSTLADAKAAFEKAEMAEWDANEAIYEAWKTATQAAQKIAAKVEEARS